MRPPKSLRRRLLGGSALLVVGLSVAFVAVSAVREIRFVQAALEQRGRDLADHLARVGRLGVLAHDPTALRPPAAAALEAPDVRAVRFLDGEDNVLLEAGVTPDPSTVQQFVAPVLAAAPDDEEGLDLFGTGGSRQTPVGRVEVVLDTSGVWDHARAALLSGALRLALFLGAGLLGARALSRRVLRPVAALTEGVRLVSEGELHHRLPDAGPAEVAALARAYNEMAAALGERTAELARQKRDAEEFVYIASHDLQSPLISIQGFADRLAGRRGPELSDEQRRWLTRILANGQHMGALIRGLLDLSRLNTRSNTEETVSSRGLVDRSVKTLRDALEDRGVTLVVQEEGWPEVSGDVPRLTAVFGNLIDNALKYLGDDNDAPRIEVGCAAGTTDHTFWVRDNGVGVPEEQRERIFRPLERLKVVDAHGIGMGLSLVRKTVELHGGEVRVESTPGEGATFSFTLPAAGGEG